MRFYGFLTIQIVCASFFNRSLKGSVAFAIFGVNLKNWFFEPIKKLMFEMFSGFFILTIKPASLSTGAVPLFDSSNPNHSLTFSNLVHLLHFTATFFSLKTCSSFLTSRQWRSADPRVALGTSFKYT